MGNNTYLLAQIFDILKIWQSLPIVFQTLKAFMSSALKFKFMTTDFFSSSLSFFLWYKKIYLLTSICDKLLGPKYRVFVKLIHVKLFLWVKIFNWAQIETSNSSSTVSVGEWYFENINISVGLWQLFRQFIVENLFFVRVKKIAFLFPHWPKFEDRNLKMSRNSTIIFWLKCQCNHRNALNTNFAMTILAVSENQGVKTSIFDKNNFLHFCGPKF